jgi:hypothetical protein
MPTGNVARGLARAALLGLLLAGGCAGPRIVKGVTQRGDKLKFVYVQDTGSSLATGAVSCTAAADATLSNCQHMQITFKE